MITKYRTIGWVLIASGIALAGFSAFLASEKAVSIAVVLVLCAVGLVDTVLGAAFLQKSRG